jgi:Sulfotransferase domain
MVHIFVVLKDRESISLFDHYDGPGGGMDGEQSLIGTAIVVGTPAPSIDHKTSSNNLTYPLSTKLKLASAEQAYLRGFWQRADPVPYDRWTALSNTTCVTEGTTRNPDGDGYGAKFQNRVPFAMLLGAQKGGTTALAQYLYSHPSIQRSPVKEFRFFDEIMDREDSLVASFPAGVGGGVPSERARRHYLETVIGASIPLPVLEVPPHLRVLDATPGYLFCADRVPPRVLCVTPWVRRFVVLLRNPVDRAFSQYHMQLHRDLGNPNNRRGFVTFEEYVELDLRVLRDVGVIPGGASSHDAKDGDNSERESEGWKTYTKLGLNSPVGRGLYSIQLGQWFEAMMAHGRDPKNEFLVLKSEDMRNDTKAAYGRVLEFLDLPPRGRAPNQYGPIHTTVYRNAKMNPETRSKLEAFFKPYNQQLEGLLGSEWHGVWEQ